MPPEDPADTRDGDEAQAPVELPLDAFDAPTLQRVAEEIVTRDGTDYGAEEKSLEQKVENLLRELRSGRAALWFNPDTETTSAEPVSPRDRR